MVENLKVEKKNTITRRIKRIFRFSFISRRFTKRTRSRLESQQQVLNSPSIENIHRIIGENKQTIKLH